MARPSPITNRVRILREAHGQMSQAALAAAIGVTRQTVIAIETPRPSAVPAVVQKASRAVCGA